MVEEHFTPNAAIPKKLFGKEIERDSNDGLDSLGKGILFLSESVTQVDFTKPNNIKYRVISSRQSGGGYGLSFPFFINFYQNNVSVFDNNLNPRGFISPIADGALNYYRYKYEGSFTEDGQMINTIKVTPRRKNEPLFSGTIQITENESHETTYNRSAARFTGSKRFADASAGTPLRGH